MLQSAHTGVPQLHPVKLGCSRLTLNRVHQEGVQQGSGGAVIQPQPVGEKLLALGGGGTPRLWPQKPCIQDWAGAPQRRLNPRGGSTSEAQSPALLASSSRDIAVSPPAYQCPCRTGGTAKGQPEWRD